MKTTSNKYKQFNVRVKIENCSLDKYSTFLIFILLLFTIEISAQTNKINPRGNWYFGSEIGLNTIFSFYAGKPEYSFQGGLSAEYYFAKQWSISARVKYFKTVVSFYHPGTPSSGWFDFGSRDEFGYFEGEVISIPLDLKWQFAVYKNLGIYMKMGPAFNIETKSHYGDYSSEKKVYPKQYINFNSVFGINYFINENWSTYLDVEYYMGGEKGKASSFISDGKQTTLNSLINVGFQYNFNKTLK